MSTQQDNLTPRQREQKWREIRYYFRRYAHWFAGGALALLATNYFGLSIPMQIGEAVEQLRLAAQGEVAADDALSALLTGAGQAIILLAIGASIARIISRILIFNAGRFIEFDLRNDMYVKLATLDTGFYNSMPTGDVTSRVTNDVAYIRLLYAICFLHIINTTLAYGIAINKMIGIDWQLTLYCLIPYPFMMIVLRSIIRAIFDQTKVVQAQLADISSKVQENLAGATVVKTFNLQERETKQFATMSEDFYNKGIRLALLRGALGALTVFVAGVGTLIVLGVGAMRVKEGSLTLGEFVEFNGYVVALAYPTQAMGWVFSVWHRGQAAFERVVAVMYRDNALTPPEEPRELPAVEPGVARGEIIFDDVNFQYEGVDQPTLRDVSLRIPAGSRVAIVGKTGSGKSTLVKLIARLYDPTSGSVRVDGLDTREVELRELRSELGYVPQEPFLFSMTIAQNMRFGLDALEYDQTIGRDAPLTSLLSRTRTAANQDERIDEAVKVAGLTRDIEAFPEGLDTMVGERGITLSGGQKQRVTIARALLTDPRILVLDDALSSVDTQTEAEILDHLDEMMRDRTTIILTHRYNALSRVDTIFVMDEGRVVERGSHDELIAASGLYARMYEQQKLRESLEE